MNDREFEAHWIATRPHVPVPILRTTTSSMSLEQIIEERSWAVKPNDDLYVDTTRMVGGFILPPFQRPLVWDEARARAFVESAWMGIHLGTIVWNDAGAEVGRNGRFHPTDYYLIDGQQRLTALCGYRSDAFPIFVGSQHEHVYSDLNTIERRKFANITIGYSKLHSRDIEMLKRAYDLLNFGGVAHTEDQRAST